MDFSTSSLHPIESDPLTGIFFPNAPFQTAVALSFQDLLALFEPQMTWISDL